MNNDLIYKRLELLPDHLKQEAADFIDFLLKKALGDERTTERKPMFGSARGKVHMSADFDDTPGDFEDYL